MKGYSKADFRKEMVRVQTKGTGFGGWSGGETDRAK
jgi:hypothetical protein